MHQVGLQPLPDISGRESFDVLVAKFSVFITKAIDSPHTFEDLQTAKYGKVIRPFVHHLVDDVHHRLTVAALLALKGDFTVAEASDERGVNATRALVCELVAWRFVLRLSDREAVDYLCAELPLSTRNKVQQSIAVQDDTNGDSHVTSVAERAALLDDTEANLEDGVEEEDTVSQQDDANSLASTFQGLSALEIAAVTNAKKFLSQKAVQRVIDGIWKGEIVFWDSLNANSKKQAKFYNPAHSDPFCRLRVPLYLKVFEVLFFAALLFFYYDVLVTKPVYYVSGSEIALYIWLAAFTHNELIEFWDAGITFYSVDFWAIWDLGIIAVGFAFFIVRMIGLTRGDRALIDTAFDILSLEALFLVPRTCSVLSLHPYFGTLLPCLKAMTKDFLKFLGLIAILYLGFNTCFAFLARGSYSFSKMSYILVKVFFGSSYLGFDVADQISPILGPPLMIIFVCLTNILLITSLISLLSTSLSRVIEHSRDEYLFVYAVYVLEASTSNRLTYFIPPFNLVPLLLRPCRLLVSADRLRRIRILLLKATHWPLVACIIGFEHGRQFLHDRRHAKSSFAASGVSSSTLQSAAALRRPLSSKSALSLPRSSHQSTPAGQQRRGGGGRKAPHSPAPYSETLDTLEQLARSLETQLDAVHLLLEQERAKLSGAASR